MLRQAYDKYLERGWVVHSLTIKTYRNKDGVEKKKPVGWTWKNVPSRFEPCKNSLSINTEESNLIVIDVDAPAVDEWTEIERLADGPFDTFTVQSASGGLHVYFNAFDHPDFNKSWSKCFTTATGAPLDIDVRGRGGVIFAPPSSFKSLSGALRRYEVTRDSPVMDMPEKLRHLLEARINRSAPGGADPTGGQRRKKRKKPAPTGSDATSSEKTDEPPEKKIMDDFLRLDVAKYIRGVFADRAKPFDAWLPIVCACANIACMYKFNESVTVEMGIEPYMLSLAHKFSKKGAEKYDCAGVDSLFQSQMERFKANPNRKHFGIPTLMDAYIKDRDSQTKTRPGRAGSSKSRRK